MRRRLKTSTLYLGLLSATLAIDFINGQFATLHIGELFRLLLVCVSFVIVASLSRKKLTYCILIYLFFIANACVEYIKYKELSQLLYNLSMGMKTTLVFLIGNALTIMMEKGMIGYKDIAKVLLVNALYGPGLFLLAKVFKLESASYMFSGQAVGSKAGFISLNTVNAALLILYCFSIYHTIRERKIYWVFLSVYILIPMIGLGTKTAILTSVLVPVLFFVIESKKMSVWRFVLLGILVLVLIAAAFWNRIYSALEGIVSMQKYKLAGRDFATYLFSTRNQRLSKVAELYYEDFCILELFVGKGYYHFHTLVGATEGGAMRPIEMEWADIFTSYGLVGMLYTYVYVIQSLIICMKRKCDEYKLHFWTAVLLLVYGSMAGHLFSEALSATLYAAVIACCNQTRKCEKNNEYKT